MVEKNFKKMYEKFIEDCYRQHNMLTSKNVSTKFKSSPLYVHVIYALKHPVRRQKLQAKKKYNDRLHTND